MSPTVTPIITPVSREDLPAIVKGLRISNGYHLAPSIFTEEERCRKQVRRYEHSWLSNTVVALKATDPTTGELMGAALWHKPGHNACCAPDPVGQHGGNRETDEDQKAWEGVDTEQQKAFWNSNDEARNRIMNGQPHYYLAPLFTAEQYKRKGVATALLKHQMAAHPDVPLAAFVNNGKPWARAMYDAVGWQTQEILIDDWPEAPNQTAKAPGTR